MKNLFRFLLLLWGLTFSSGGSQQTNTEKTERPATFLSEKTTQTCDACQIADSLRTT
jgi:hypothetical protein